MLHELPFAVAGNLRGLSLAVFTRFFDIRRTYPPRFLKNLSRPYRHVGAPISLDAHPLANGR
jgi:hypothetical protein